MVGTAMAVHWSRMAFKKRKEKKIKVCSHVIK